MMFAVGFVTGVICFVLCLAIVYKGKTDKGE